jgi:hypothetical protein
MPFDISQVLYLSLTPLFFFLPKSIRKKTKKSSQNDRKKLKNVCEREKEFERERRKKNDFDKYYYRQGKE